MVSKEEINNFKDRCEFLIAKVKKDFPLLKDVKIYLEFRNLKGSMQSKKVISNYVISIDSKKYMDAKDNEIIGALVHELAHLETYKKKNFFEMIWFGAHYLFSRKFSKEVDRNADNVVLERGYGNELLANRLFLEKIDSKKELHRLRENYLTLEEIESYLRKNDIRN